MTNWPRANARLTFLHFPNYSSLTTTTRAKDATATTSGRFDQRLWLRLGLSDGFSRAPERQESRVQTAPRFTPPEHRVEVREARGVTEALRVERRASVGPGADDRVALLARHVRVRVVVGAQLLGLAGVVLELAEAEGRLGQGPLPLGRHGAVGRGQDGPDFGPWAAPRPARGEPGRAVHGRAHDSGGHERMADMASGERWRC